MTSDDIVASYFVRISQRKDPISAIGETIPKSELVNTTLDGLPRSWDAFPTGIRSKKETPTFEELWTSCAQKESRIISRDGKEEPTQAFAAQFKKSRGKKKGGSQGKGLGKKKDMSRIQYYGCQKYGHFKKNCPELANNKWRKRKQHAFIIDVEDEHPKKPKGDKDFF